MITTFISPKGGCGSTTLALSLLNHLNDGKMKNAFVDCSYRRNRYLGFGKHTTHFKHVNSLNAQYILGAHLQTSNYSMYNHTVIDAHNIDKDNLTFIAQISDRIIVPFTIDDFSLHLLPSFVNEFSRFLKPSTKIILLPNMFANTEKQKDILSSLEKMSSSSKHISIAKPIPYQSESSLVSLSFIVGPLCPNVTL